MWIAIAVYFVIRTNSLFVHSSFLIMAISGVHRKTITNWRSPPSDRWFFNKQLLLTEIKVSFYPRKIWKVLFAMTLLKEKWKELKSANNHACVRVRRELGIKRARGNSQCNDEFDFRAMLIKFGKYQIKAWSQTKISFRLYSFVYKLIGLGLRATQNALLNWRIIR